MNCPTLCNVCYPNYWAANSPKQMQKHLADHHNIMIHNPYDLLDYFTRWDDEKQEFPYIGIVVKVPNGKSVIIVQKETIASAKDIALRQVRMTNNRNRKCKILVVRKQTIQITANDMLLNRRAFNEGKFGAGMNKSLSSHTQRLSENEGVKAIV